MPSALAEAHQRANRQLEHMRQKAPRNQSASLVSLLGGSTFGMSGFGVDQQEALEAFAGWVYAAITPIVKRLSAQPIRVARKRRASQGSEKHWRTVPSSKRCDDKQLPVVWQKEVEQFEMLDNHALVDLIEDPSEAFAMNQLVSLFATYLEISGRAQWIVIDVDGRTQICPAIPTTMSPDHAQGLFANWTLRAGAASRTIAGADVVHTWFMDPKNPLEPYGPTQACMTAIQTDQAVEGAQNYSFKNGCNPGLLLFAGDPTQATNAQSFGPLLTSMERTQIIEAIATQHEGYRNFNRPMILDALIRDAKKLSNTPDEMAFKDSAELTKAKVFEIYGVNPIIAGHIEGANRASSAIADKHFCFNTVNPLADAISQAMTRTLGRKFAKPNEKLYVWIEPAVPDDSEDRRANVDMAARYGALTLNQILSSLGYETIGPQGDVAPKPFSLMYGEVGENDGFDYGGTSEPDDAYQDDAGGGDGASE